MVDADRKEQRLRSAVGWLSAVVIVGFIVWGIVAGTGTSQNQGVLGANVPALTLTVPNTAPGPPPASGPSGAPTALGQVPPAVAIAPSSGLPYQNNARTAQSTAATARGIALGPVAERPALYSGKIVNDSAVVATTWSPRASWVTPVGSAQRIFAILDENNASAVQLNPGLVVQLQAVVEPAGAAPPQQPNLNDVEHRQISAAPYLDVFAIQVIQRTVKGSASRPVGTYTTVGAPAPIPRSSASP